MSNSPTKYGWSWWYHGMLRDWVEHTGVAVGDPVFVLSPTENYDWYDYVPNMDHTVGKIAYIHSIDLEGGCLKLDDGYTWPFYALIPLNK